MYSNISVEEDTDFELNDKVDVQYEKEGGTYYPGRISKINDNNTYDINYRDGDAEVSVPSNRILKDKDIDPTSVNQGDYVDVRWPDNNGQYYPAKIDIVVESSGPTVQSCNIIQYGVTYYDGGCEGPVDISRIRKPEHNAKRFQFDPNSTKVSKSLQTDQPTWNKYLEYQKKKMRLKGATAAPLNGAQNTCWLCCVPPWSLHYIFFAPCIWCPCLIQSQICPSRYGYEEYPMPSNADNILEITQKGIVGNVVSIGGITTGKVWKDSYITHFSGDKSPPRGSICWKNFDMDSVVIRKESEHHTEAGSCYPICCSGEENTEKLTTNTTGITVGVGLCLPCCAYVCSNPKQDDDVYSVEIKSKDGLIVLSAPALNIPPEVLLETLNKYHTLYKQISSSMKEETGQDCPW